MFVRLGEECSLVAYEIVKAIENVTIFGDFVKHLITELMEWAFFSNQLITGFLVVQWL